jgi:DNA-binding MarR family transcriptional regulator
MSDPPRQVTYALVRHLAMMPRWSTGEIPTAAWTQAGLAEALGVGQSTASRILRRLVAAQVVASETSHVAGLGRRMRVYQLTPRGERLGQALRETRLESSTAPVSGGVPTPVERTKPRGGPGDPKGVAVNQ